jgi:hypothetical protein
MPGVGASRYHEGLLALCLQAEGQQSERRKSRRRSIAEMHESRTTGFRA